MSATPLPRPTAPADSRVRRVLRRMRLFLAVATAVVAVDQWSKALVRARLDFGESWPAGWEWIRFTYVENTGAAFGAFQGASDVLAVVALVAVAAITFALLALPVRGRLYTIALSGILGGAVGNLIDRVRFGAVTDFIDPAYYPAFNIADSAIVMSVGLLLALTWFERDAPGATTEGAR